MHFSFTKPVNGIIILQTITAQCLYSVVMGGDALNEFVCDSYKEILSDKITVAKG